MPLPDCPPPLPPPLRGAETGTFTHRTITERLPSIARRTVQENSPGATEKPLPPQALAGIETLIAEIPTSPLRPIRDPGAPDQEDWEHYMEPHVGQDWLQAPWFLAEHYFYRRILEATGYFQPGPGQGVDPFALQKRQGLENSDSALYLIDALLPEFAVPSSSKTSTPLFPFSPDFTSRLLHLDLWGNQADLSQLHLGREQALGYKDVGGQLSHLLIDDTQALLAYLGALPRPRRIDFLPDNAGLELLFDLITAGYLLHSGLAEIVQFHLKAHPTFVSDALIKDAVEAVDFLASRSPARVGALGKRLQDDLRAGHLILVDHFFWNSPLPAWQMPPDLIQELGAASLLISKGDANYRRLLGDRHWPLTTPFTDIVCYSPVPLAALRVLKAEIATGLQPGEAEALDAEDPSWLFDGQWGIIQFTG